MNTRIDEITDETVVEVFNDYNSSVSYKLDRVERSWDINTVKKIKVAELYEAVNIKGARFLLEENMLLIKDAGVREILGLSPLTKYSVNLKEINNLLTKGTVAELEDLLQYCSNTTLEKIVAEAIKIPIENMAKARLIQSYSGIDVISIIQEYDASTSVSKENNKEEKSGTVRRKRVAKE